jgi:hypothetical protein
MCSSRRRSIAGIEGREIDLASELPREIESLRRIAYCDLPTGVAL